MTTAGQWWGRARAGLSAVLADRPSALELVVGPDRFPAVLARALGAWLLVVPGSCLVALLLPRPDLPDVHQVPLVAMTAFFSAVGLVFLLSPERAPLVASMGIMWLGPVVVAGGLALVGPSLAEAAVLLGAVGISACLFLRRRAAFLWALVTVLSYGLVLALQDGHPAPVQRAILVIGPTLGTTGALVWLVGKVEGLARDEHDARTELDAAHRALAEANGQLAEQVHRQVDEISALRRLRRFLAPQVAAAVLADGDEALLAPHRRRIAVVFCDLRGFTHFSSDAAPEETIEELHDYFQVVGEHLEAYEATVGMFAGDGIMAYFGDPVPHPDPAGAAVAMCMALRAPMAQLQARWDRRGYDLGYGIGVAYGFATMGTIGFRARSEYTPLGPVVNLASRLCSAARDGEVLVDARTIDAVADRVEAQARSLSLRGFDLPITAYDVTAWLGAPVLAVSDPEHRSVAGVAPLEG